MRIVITYELDFGFLYLKVGELPVNFGCVDEAIGNVSYQKEIRPPKVN